ncbi:MAG: phosphate signaling complex PhoU family protein [Candidatus Methanomethylophilaceae archaeon]
MMKFEDEMEALKGCMAGMADLTSDMVGTALSAVADIGRADPDMLSDEFAKVDRYDRRIEEASIRILTLYHPMASDMRAVATYLKCITYLERIAKYSRNIAKAAAGISGSYGSDVLEDVLPMGRTAVRMVEIVVAGLKNASVEGFDALSDMDTLLDSALRDGLTHVVDRMKSEPECADAGTYCISVMKYLERIGDHACKIAEKVTFMVTGFHTVIE